MALTNSKNTTTGRTNYITVPMAASTKIYAGACVCADASGNAVNAANTSGLKFLGVASATVDNSAGLAAAINITIQSVQAIETLILKGSSVDKTWRGKLVYFTDEETVTTTAGNAVIAGVVVDALSATTVAVDPHRTAA